MLHCQTYEQNCQKFYTISLGQLSKNIKVNLEGMEEWDTINNDHDMVRILKIIKDHMLNHK